MYTVVKDSHGNQKVCLSVCGCERERAVHVHDIHNVFMSSLGGGGVGVTLMRSLIKIPTAWMKKGGGGGSNFCKGSGMQCFIHCNEKYSL